MRGLYLLKSILANETLCRTTMRKAAASVVVGFVNPRNTTCNPVRSETLKATLKTVSTSRRLLRKAFRKIKPGMLTDNFFCW